MPDSIRGEADDDTGTKDAGYPAFSYQQLKQVNPSRQHLVNDPAVVNTLLALASIFIQRCKPTIVREWMKDSKEEVTDKCQAPLQKFLEGHDEVVSLYLKKLPASQKEYFSILLELVVVGILYDTGRGSRSSHSIPHFTRRQLYRLLLIAVNMSDKADDEDRARMTKELEDEQEQRRLEFTSKDKDKEDDQTLAPAQKARVLWNALRERNDIGHLDIWDKFTDDGNFDGVDHSITKEIIFTRDDMPKMIAFFQQNRQMTVADVLTILDASLELSQKNSYPQNHDDLWHVRRGHVVSFLLEHIRRIAHDLEKHTGIRYTVPSPNE